MQAEVIAVGSELTTGAKLDTNSQWLSLELADLGIPVQLHTTIADHLPAMVSNLRAATERSQLVVITGGLGPTLDDLTRQAMAELTGSELALHEPSLEIIREMFASRGREMPERNIVQAMFPAGSEVIPNRRGTAPGIWMPVPSNGRGKCTVVALPGVPSEMKPMFREEVRPRLQGNGRVIRRARINCFGVGESKAEEMLGALTARGGDPDVGITVHEGTITLRITAQGGSEADCLRKIAGARETVCARMGPLVFGEEDDELEHALVRLLTVRGLTLSTAESGTGGLVAHRLTGVGGFETCYLGGVIAPADAAKEQLLNVPLQLIQDAGAVSAEVAAAMARGCRERFGTDFALAITEESRSVARTGRRSPAVFLALAGEDLLEVSEEPLLGDSAISRSRNAKALMNLLRLKLLLS